METEQLFKDRSRCYIHEKEGGCNAERTAEACLQHPARGDSEYITWIDIRSLPNDMLTLIPFLKDMEKHLGFKYTESVADAGYESKKSYRFIEENGQTAYIKPQNYAISET